MTKQDLIDAFYDEIPVELQEMTADAEVTRWLNQGRQRLGYYVEETAALTWTAGDRTVTLPTDFFRPVELITDASSVIPAYRIHGGTLFFLHSDGASTDGAATLLYEARVPQITDAQDSTLTEEGNEAIIAFARYRFFAKLAASRSDYRRYSTILGANAVSVDDLDGLAAGYLADFQAAQDTLPVDDVASFYGD